MSIDKIRNIGLDKLVTQVYDFDSLTTDELMCKFAQKINIIIEHLKYIDDRCYNSDKAMEEKLQYLLGEGLEKQVARRILELINNGTLGELINENLLNDINDKVEDITLNISDFGAIGDGIFNNTTIINDVVSKANKNTIIKIPVGEFLVDDLSCLVKGNVTLIGVDNTKSIITTKNGTDVNSMNNILFEKIQFKNLRLFSNNNSNVVIKDCVFKDSNSNCLYLQNPTDITIKGNKFINIGVGITDYTSSGKAIMLHGVDTNTPTNNVLIEGNYFEEIKGNSCICFLGYLKDYEIKKNNFKNNVWGAIQHWETVHSGFGVIDGNYIYGCGFGTPAIGDKNALTSGVGCSAIYANSECYNTKVINNRIYKSVENGIEGAFGEISNNYIDGTGVNSDIRKTPSIEGIWIDSLTLTKSQKIDKNIIINTKGNGIVTSVNSQYNELVITNNIIDSLIASIYINVVKIDKLVVFNNKIKNISIWISTHSNLVANINDLVIDNYCIVNTNNYIHFDKGYVKLSSFQDDTKEPYFNGSAWSLTNATISDNVCSMNEWSRISQAVIKTVPKTTKKTVILKIEYTTAIATTLEALRFNIGGKMVILNGSDGATITKNVLLTIDDSETISNGCSLENSSNFNDGTYQPVSVSFLKANLISS